MKLSFLLRKRPRPCPDESLAHLAKDRALVSAPSLSSFGPKMSPLSGFLLTRLTPDLHRIIHLGHYYTSSRPSAE